ncbi:unnamed protein product [Camellia sinensis]
MIQRFSLVSTKQIGDSSEPFQFSLEIEIEIEIEFHLSDSDRRGKQLYSQLPRLRSTTPVTNEGLQQGYCVVPSAKRFILLYSFLKRNLSKKVMVFFSSCNSVKFHSELLRYIHVDCFDIHGKQKQQRRTSTFFDFCKAEKGILLCTEVAARCLDIPAVDWILQYDPPDEPKVDDKYQYSTEDKDNRVHGWICFDPPVGFWQITPSNEFRTGGPFKQDLTSHVNPTTLANRKIGDNTYKGTTWQIKFTLENVDQSEIIGTYKLRPTLASVHNSELQVEDSLSSHPTVRPMSHQQQSHAFSSQEGVR